MPAAFIFGVPSENMRAKISRRGTGGKVEFDEI
jgi:hypothetical protein